MTHRDSGEALQADIRFDLLLREGQVVEAAWTHGVRGGGVPTHRYRASARITKINAASVWVTTLETATSTGQTPSTAPAGTELRLPRWPWSRWPHKGVWPLEGAV